MLHRFFLFALLYPLLSSPLRAQDQVLLSWHDFSEGFQIYLTAADAKSATSADFRSVTGNMYGGKGSRDTWGSSDGTFGPATPVGTTAADGAMALRTNGNNLTFTITNGGKRNLYLSEILFDFASVSTNSPRNFNLFYLSGGLSDPNNTLLQAFPSSQNRLGINSDYEDAAVPLDALADRTLAPNQTATFRFVAENASNQFQAMAIDNIAITGRYADFAALTYNIHGGKGPDDEGTVTSNLTVFRDNFMHDEDVLCLQEVDFDNGEWDIIKGIFSDYPHTFQTINTTTRYSGILSFLNRSTSIAILSKHPFTSTHDELIQIDPQGDEWERHAQHVTINLEGETINLFNFHNTYNFFDNDSQSEKEGLTKFRTYVLSRPGIKSLTSGSKSLLLGDFNVLQVNVIDILDTPARRSNGLDHISSIPLFTQGGAYGTFSADLSDHNAVWVALDLEAPSLDTAVSNITPTSPTTITVTASAADNNGLQYLIKNLTFQNGSHDSPWQNSPIHLDTGLSPNTTYSYSITTRDLSPNANQSVPSVPFIVTTPPIPDGDVLPDDWELTYFPDLTSTSGGPTEDFDLDGATDLQEYLAGTDPTHAQSKLRSWIESDTSGQFNLKWTSVPGKTYQIQTSPDLETAWQPHLNPIEATTEITSQTLTTTSAALFLRVSTQPAPEN